MTGSDIAEKEKTEIKPVTIEALNPDDLVRCLPGWDFSPPKADGEAYWFQRIGDTGNPRDKSEITVEIEPRDRRIQFYINSPGFGEGKNPLFTLSNVDEVQVDVASDVISFFSSERSGWYRISGAGTTFALKSPESLSELNLTLNTVSNDSK